jgi:transcription antitermination factor NusG
MPTEVTLGDAPFPCWVCIHRPEHLSGDLGLLVDRGRGSIGGEMLDVLVVPRAPLYPREVPTQHYEPKPGHVKSRYPARHFDYRLAQKVFGEDEDGDTFVQEHPFQSEWDMVVWTRPNGETRNELLSVVDVDAQRKGAYPYQLLFYALDSEVDATSVSLEEHPSRQELCAFDPWPLRGLFSRDPSALVRFDKLVNKEAPTSMARTWDIAVGDVVRVIAGEQLGERGVVVSRRRGVDVVDVKLFAQEGGQNLLLSLFIDCLDRALEVGAEVTCMHDGKEVSGLIIWIEDLATLTMTGPESKNRLPLKCAEVWLPGDLPSVSYDARFIAMSLTVTQVRVSLRECWPVERRVPAREDIGANGFPTSQYAQDLVEHLTSQRRQVEEVSQAVIFEVQLSEYGPLQDIYSARSVRVAGVTFERGRQVAVDRGTFRGYSGVITQIDADGKCLTFCPGSDTPGAPLAVGLQEGNACQQLMEACMPGASALDFVLRGRAKGEKALPHRPARRRARGDQAGLGYSARGEREQPQRPRPLGRHCICGRNMGLVRQDCHSKRHAPSEDDVRHPPCVPVPVLTRCFAVSYCAEPRTTEGA